MDTSANKELVCMLLQGIANKLPEQVLLIIANGMRLKKAILRLWYIAFKHCNKSLGGMFDGK